MPKTKVVGVTYEGRQDVINSMNEMLDNLIAKREPENPHDENAIAIYVEKHNGELQSVGYINRGLAAKLSPVIKEQNLELIIDDYVIVGNREAGKNLGIIFNYTLYNRDKGEIKV